MSRWIVRLVAASAIALAIAFLGPWGLVLAGSLVWLLPVAVVVWWGAEVLQTLRRIERKLDVPSVQAERELLR